MNPDSNRTPLIAGKYRVIDRTGSDSVCEFFRCSAADGSGPTVIVKMFFPEIRRNPKAVARVRDSVTRFSPPIHEYVAHVLEFNADGPDAYFVVEDHEGADVYNWCSDLRPIPAVVALLIDVAEGLAALHRREIIHRNVKPEVIFSSAEGRGILGESVLAAGAAPITDNSTNGVVGELDLVSPEYLQGGELSFSGDIYCLGSCAYELITGRSPFLGKSVIDTMMKRLNDEVPDPREFRPDCPDSLADVIVRATRRRPEQRYHHADELAADMKSLV